MAALRHIVFLVMTLIVMAACNPLPYPGGYGGGGGGKHEHYIIHVPYHVHTIHHHHVKKIPIYVKESHHHYTPEYHHSHHGWD